MAQTIVSLLSHLPEGFYLIDGTPITQTLTGYHYVDGQAYPLYSYPEGSYKVNEVGTVYRWTLVRHWSGDRYYWILVDPSEMVPEPANEIRLYNPDIQDFYWEEGGYSYPITQLWVVLEDNWAGVRRILFAGWSSSFSIPYLWDVQEVTQNAGEYSPFLNIHVPPISYSYPYGIPLSVSWGVSLKDFLTKECVIVKTASGRQNLAINRIVMLKVLEPIPAPIPIPELIPGVIQEWLTRQYQNGLLFDYEYTKWFDILATVTSFPASSDILWTLDRDFWESTQSTLQYKQVYIPLLNYLTTGAIPEVVSMPVPEFRNLQASFA